VNQRKLDEGTRNWPASPHEATKFILDQVPGCEPVEGAPPQGERYSHGEDVPVVLTPEVLEGSTFRAIHVADPRSIRGESRFAGFLDGTQDVRVVNHVYGIPIVWATVSAAIRARVERRLISWSERQPIISRGYYLPFRYIDGMSDVLRSHPNVVDTAKGTSSENIPSRHPAALMEAAMQRVQLDRESIEIQLAEAWCAREKTPLYIDGSITGSKNVSTSPIAIGVVKTHRRLYADGDAFRTLVGLRAGERSSIFKVSPRSRFPVASWYVRIRPATGRDALFGLVRVEASIIDSMSERASEISRWIIAEGAPLALPDGRWDKMSYGIRETEEFLRAIS
jgi:hypothetical protein